MSSNSFGKIFKITTWGESHGKAIGVVIDGCPAGIKLCNEDFTQDMQRRASHSKNPCTTPRHESDTPCIYSGVFEGQTTGAPISIIIENKNIDSNKYEPIKHLLRPGHANYTYLNKYGIFDYKGGGRASARETACRVAAGVVAKKLLAHYSIDVISYIKSIGKTIANDIPKDIQTISINTQENYVACPDVIAANTMINEIEFAKSQGDSLGGIVEFTAQNLPIGLGDPIYEKLEASLANAMMSIPATKAFSIGQGFFAAEQTGSEHNDEFININSNQIRTKTNAAGGILGGISNGEVLYGHVAFKPTSSIKKTQRTTSITGNETEFKLPSGSRHDPCVAIRAVPVVEAMLALVLADCVLMNRCVQL